MFKLTANDQCIKTTETELLPMVDHDGGQIVRVWTEMEVVDDGDST